MSADVSAAGEAEWHNVDPKAALLWRFQGVIRSVVGLGPLLVGLGFGVSLVGGWRTGSIVSFSLLALAFVQALVWPSLAWRAFRYAVRDDALLVQQGVLFQHTVAVPRHRIQHADLRQGPVERAFGLTSLVLYTAAGTLADAGIPGLDEDVAELLRDELLKRSEPGDGGV